MFRTYNVEDKEGAVNAVARFPIVPRGTRKDVLNSSARSFLYPCRPNFDSGSISSRVL